MNNMSNFEGHINGHKPVLVDFFAEWCGPCKMMGPVLQEVKGAVGDRATLLKLDIDKNPAYAQQYGVQAVPTLILFKNGQVLWRKSGLVPAHEILRQLQACIA
jgi:thioredoxin 1